MRRPAKRWINGTTKGMRKYVARVQGIEKKTLIMRAWRVGNTKQELFFNVAAGLGITFVGKFSAGTPVEMWIWTEKVGGKTFDRVHIKSYERRGWSMVNK